MFHFVQILRFSFHLKSELQSKFISNLFFFFEVEFIWMLEAWNAVEIKELFLICAHVCLTDDVVGIVDEAIRSMTLGFELPRNFLHPERYLNPDLDDDWFSLVPEVVSTALFETMSVDVPIDPQMPFVFVRQNLLPQFVVAWFMAFIPAKRIAKSTRFFRALNAIEQYREFIFFPPNSHDVLDPIVAGGGALPHHLLPGGEEQPASDQGDAEGSGQGVGGEEQPTRDQGEAEAGGQGVGAEKEASQDDPLNVGFVDDTDED